MEKRIEKMKKKKKKEKKKIMMLEKIRGMKW